MSATRLSFRSQYKFPLKLFQIANDGLIIKWTDDGKRLVVEENDFEANVMKLYPGFVQVETFHNLRRLFRDYGFKFRILRKRKPYGAKVEFRHPYFLRDSPDTILRVKKRNRWQLMIPRATSSPKYFHKNKKWQTIPSHPRGLGRFDRPKSNQDLSIDSENTFFESDTLDCTDIDSRLNTSNSCSKHMQKFTFDDHRPGPKIPKAAKHRKTKLRQNDPELFNLLQIYAKNELTEAEFWEVVTKRCDRPFRGESWEDAMNFINSIVNHELSPLHFKGYFCELSLAQM